MDTLNNKYQQARYFSKNKALLFAITGLVLSAIFQVKSTTPILYEFGVLVAIITLFSVFFLPKKYLLIPVFVMMINMPDLTQSFEEIDAFGQISVPSVWQLFLGPVTPAVFAFLILLVVLVRIFSYPILASFKGAIIYFTFFTVLVSIYFGYFQESFARFFSDAKLILFFCTGIVIFLSYFKRFPQYVARSSQIFLLLLAGNFVFDLLKFIFYKPEVVAAVSYNSLSLDSIKGLITVVSFFSISKLVERKSILLNILIIIISLYMLLAYQTRWLVITFFLGLVLVSFFLGLKKSLLIGFGLTLFISVTIPILIRFAPDVWNIAMIRFSFIENLKPGATLEDVELARAGAIYNSTNTIWDRKAFLTGFGYGSWYTDSYFPMPFLTTAGFDQDSLDKSQYYRVHDFFFHFFFKYGLVGLLLYSMCFILPIKNLWKLKKRFFNDSNFKRLSIIMIGNFPMVLTALWFTGKSLLVSAFFVVIIYCWAGIYSKLATRMTQ